MSGLCWPIRGRRWSGRSVGSLWQSWWHGCCDRRHAKANCWDISSLCWRSGISRASWCNSVTSAISRQPVAILSAEICAQWSLLKFVSLCDGVQAVAENWAANWLVCRQQGFFVAAPSRASQCFQHIIALLHFYCDIVAVFCESEMGV